MLQWWIWYIPVMYTGLFVFDCLKQSRLFMHIHVPKSLKDKKEIFVIFAFSIILQLLTQNFDYLRLIETVQRPKSKLIETMQRPKIKQIMLNKLWDSTKYQQKITCCKITHQNRLEANWRETIEFLPCNIVIMTTVIAKVSMTSKSVTTVITTRLVDRIHNITLWTWSKALPNNCTWTYMCKATTQ